MEQREIRFRALYEGVWYSQTLEELLTITLAAFRNGKHKTQFTGILDKNNKPIYEGDVCHIFIGVPQEIVFVNGAFGYNSDTKEFISFAQNRWLEITGSKSNEIEVWGNIFEHPHLINKKNP
jgi:uncharacterized phage protein (TIGR01671 family)